MFLRRVGNSISVGPYGRPFIMFFMRVFTIRILDAIRSLSQNLGVGHENLGKYGDRLEWAVEKPRLFFV